LTLPSTKPFVIYFIRTLLTSSTSTLHSTIEEPCLIQLSIILLRISAIIRDLSANINDLWRIQTRDL